MAISVNPFRTLVRREEIAEKLRANQLDGKVCRMRFSMNLFLLSMREQTEFYTNNIRWLGCWKYWALMICLSFLNTFGYAQDTISLKSRKISGRVLKSETIVERKLDTGEIGETRRSYDSNGYLVLEEYFLITKHLKKQLNSYRISYTEGYNTAVKVGFLTAGNKLFTDTSKIALNSSGNYLTIDRRGFETDIVRKDSSEYHTIEEYNYNANGKLNWYVAKTALGELLDSVSFQRNAHDQPVEKVIWNRHREKRITYVYDADKNLIRTVESDRNGNITSEYYRNNEGLVDSVSIRISSAPWPPPAIKTILYEYDRSNRLVRESKTYASYISKDKSETVFKYYRNGLIRKEIHMFFGETDSGFRPIKRVHYHSILRTI